MVLESCFEEMVGCVIIGALCRLCYLLPVLQFYHYIYNDQQIQYQETKKQIYKKMNNRKL